MRQKIFLTLAILGIILVSGCISQKPSDVKIGGTSTYVNLDTCPEKARFVITQYNLSMIHSCNVEYIKYNSQTVSIVRLSLGPGGDCLSGCIYASQSYLVLENNTIYQIFDAPGDASAFSDFIWYRIKIPISDINKISTKEIVDYNGVVAYKFTPIRYIQGELYYVLDGKQENLKFRISGNISPREITVDNARELAIDELKTKGYTPVSFKEPYKVYNSDCWYFVTESEPQKFFCQGYVQVCLDGRTENKLTNCVVNRVP